MPFKLGTIRQMGYLVHDLDKAMAEWTARLGVGPWYKLEGLAFDNFRYRGVDTPVDAMPDIVPAITNVGDLQIELIEQRNDVPSHVKTFLDEHGEGLQHIAVWTEDYDTTYAEFRNNGLTLDLEFKLTGAGRACFFEPRLHAGTAIELNEITSVGKKFMGTIREACIDWDGRDPVRVVKLS